MKTNKSVITVFIERDFEDINLLAEIEKLKTHISFKEFIIQYPTLFAFYDLLRNETKENDG